MPDTTARPGPPIYLAILLFFAACFFFLSNNWHNSVAGLLSDDAVYLLLAESYFASPPEHVPVLDFVRFNSNFPPLYPLLLGLLGVTSSKVALASIITNLFLLIALLVFGIWIHRESRQPMLAILLPAITALLPATLILSRELWSEFLFMCFLYAAFACNHRDDRHSQSWLWVAAFVALASLTRSAGLGLVGAFVLLLIVKRPTRSLLAGAIAVLPVALWNLTRFFTASKRGYLADWLEQIGRQDLAQFKHFLYEQITTGWHSWQWLYGALNDGAYATAGKVALIALLLGAAAGWLMRLRNAKLDALFVPAYLLMVLLWPYTGTYFVSRFIYVLLPAFIYYNWELLARLAHRPLASRLSIIGLGCALAMIAAPTSHRYLQRLYTPVQASLAPYTNTRKWLTAANLDTANAAARFHGQMISALQATNSIMPVSACAFAVSPALAMLHTRRIVFLTPSPQGTDENFFSRIAGCDYVIALGTSDAMGKYPPYYPLQRLSGQRDTHYRLHPVYANGSDTQRPLLVLAERLPVKPK
jgi:hypothetical protein